MELSTQGLVLADDARVDLHLHTVYSDGEWEPEGLLEHLIADGFGLAAITDHDRVDILAGLQRLAGEKGFPLLAGVEMTSSWRGELLDLLCFGFDPERNELAGLTADLCRQQSENTREVYENLQRQGYRLSGDPEELASLVAKPSAQQPHALVSLLKAYGYGSAELSIGRIVTEAGIRWITHDFAAVVAAAQGSGGVCLVAHPGRGDGFVSFDEGLLDALRNEAPIDGVEAHYPAHTPAQTGLYLNYARKHGLLVSAGSDSHRSSKPPIPYRAELSRELLERLGISSL